MRVVHNHTQIFIVNHWLAPAANIQLMLEGVFVWDDVHDSVPLRILAVELQPA
jgi:hypothetical protein